MNWNSIPNDERLRLWKTLRNDLLEFDLHSQLKKLTEFCFSMPLGARTIDYYSPTEWPTPWEILFYGEFCTSSISLLMYYTLTLVGISDVELFLIDDYTDIFLIPVIDNKFILNYELGYISNLSEVMGDIKILNKIPKELINKI